MRVYISGPITGDPEYKKHFQEAAAELASRGYDVVNPAEAFDERGLTYQQIIKIDLLLLETCDYIYMLPGWPESTGARCEYAYAEAIGLKIMFFWQNRKEEK